MTRRPLVLLAAWMAEEVRQQLAGQFPECRFEDARDRAVLERLLPEAEIVYGIPPAELLAKAEHLRWIQLPAAGVPWDLCDALKDRNVIVTNLAGLYGPTIAEHALGLMLAVSRNFHVAFRQQSERTWQRDLSKTMRDLHGRTAAIVGVGNIGQNIARLCRCFGMRVVGCRRTTQMTPHVDQLYPCERVKEMVSEADYVVVAAPLTRQTRGMLGPAEFSAMKPGTIYVNVSRGAVAEEQALLDALRSGHLFGAGLDVFAVEPLPPEHPLWTMPNVIITPHYSGETVNQSAQPGHLFIRNLRRFLKNEEIGHRVNLEAGY
ncbi:MAG: D-2-hydroxyacid dehydrogenase [Gemmatales bacterium]|nr:D-2-hydroxyacid dehydrogenase [Gemmatales bacterium]MDW8386466.1 D-2-hydroxyacid dehydrogenase [Gemmatales bacterium]